ncbi:hypothetical protein [Microbacterium sp.]
MTERTLSDTEALDLLANALRRTANWSHVFEILERTGRDIDSD